MITTLCLLLNYCMHAEWGTTYDQASDSFVLHKSNINCLAVFFFTFYNTFIEYFMDLVYCYCMLVITEHSMVIFTIYGTI